ncbi:TRAP transporter substrate-binding protein DctP [Thermodesulfobacteriota bacterium]
MKNLQVKMFMFVAIVVTLTLFLGASPAISASKVINLTLGQIYGSTHTFSMADKAWIAKIEKETNGRVKVKAYWGGTLLSRREHTDELIKGVADFSYLGPRTGFPLHLGSIGFPYGEGDYEKIKLVYKEIGKMFPELDKEFSSKLKIMAKSVGFTYQLITNKPIRKASDFKGKMIKATGAYTRFIKAMGGEGVNVSMGDVYVALQKGTIDGALAPYEAYKSFKLHEVAKYCTAVDLSSAVRPTRGMNLNSYKKLPKDIQEIFNKSIEFWSNEDSKWRINADKEGLEMGKKLGVEIIKLAPEDTAKIHKAAEKAFLVEATRLDEKGLPGTKLFKEVRRLLEKYNK